MKIINHTHWNTADLRRIIVQVAQDELTPEERKHMVVTVKYNRQKDNGYCSGHAWLLSYSCNVNVPSGVINSRSLAMVTAHEFAHCRGWDHQKMRGMARYHKSSWPGYDWAEGIDVRRKEDKKPARLKGAALADQQLKKSQAKLTAWQRRAKLAAKKVKTWQHKVRYYQRRLEQLQGEEA